MLKSGMLLLAQPYLLDPNFKRSVIALVDHHASGSVGFVLNHPLDWRVSDVIQGFPDFNAFMNFGGPVQRDTLHFLHTLGAALSDSIHVIDDIYWGGDFEQLSGMIEMGTATPAEVKFFLGYSGWSEGQLEEEMLTDTWITTELREDIVFQTEPDQIWPLSMRRLGNTFEVLSHMDEESLN